MLRRGEPGGDDGGSGDGPNRARRGEAPPSVGVAESSDVRALSLTRSVSLAYEALAATTDTGGGLCFSLPFSLALCVSIPLVVAPLGLEPRGTGPLIWLVDIDPCFLSLSVLSFLVAAEATFVELADAGSAKGLYG